MSFRTKTVTIGGKDVTVICEQASGAGSPCQQVTFIAEVEGQQYRHSMTIGPVDGPTVEVTAEQLQRDVDAAREYAATHAHFHHRVRVTMPLID